ncbi:hypothetical protein LCGC14_0564900 [marine sediment metagenome]|uniref:Uncharacterized protein n=1 Tax=marine sediment metagenome TaxID=412755 RepID=A0A0F9S4H0_9ZZZZ
MASETYPGAAFVGDSNFLDLNLGATAVNDIDGGGCTLYLVDVDNSANSAASFIKFWDAAAPDVGTDAPMEQYKIAASKREVWIIPRGLTFGTGLSLAMLTVGGTGGAVSPASAVIVRLNYNTT